MQEAARFQQYAEDDAKELRSSPLRSNPRTKEAMQRAATDMVLHGSPRRRA